MAYLGHRDQNAMSALCFGEASPLPDFSARILAVLAAVALSFALNDRLRREFVLQQLVRVATVERVACEQESRDWAHRLEANQNHNHNQNQHQNARDAEHAASPVLCSLCYARRTASDHSPGGLGPSLAQPSRPRGPRSESSCETNSEIGGIHTRHRGGPVSESSTNSEVGRILHRLRGPMSESSCETNSEIGGILEVSRV